MIDTEEARRVVQQILESWTRDGAISCVAGSAMDEGDRWVVGYQSRAYLIDGDFNAALVDNPPFAVPKDGSAPYQLSRH